jgi:uroporphyrinogen-III decarboxylase
MRKTKEEMSPKERWLGALHMQPLDRLPFWPKLNASYPLMRKGKFRQMSLEELHEYIGSDRHTHIPAVFTENRTHTEIVVNETNTERKTEYRTQVGTILMVEKFDYHSQSWHPVKHPIASIEDIRTTTALYNDVEIDLDREALQTAQERYDVLGGDSLAPSGIAKSALMHTVEWGAGVKNAHLLLADYPDEMTEMFEAIHRVVCEKAKIQAEHSPADALYMTENTSTTLISPAQYMTYCYDHIVEYARICNAFDKPLILHMCGHLKALRPELATIPARAFEAFTSPTLGNTTLLDGRVSCPETCLVGGTNAMLWTRSTGEIISQIERDLDALPHERGIVVTSAGVMPPLCEPDTIREVCEWTKNRAARWN